MSGNSAKRSTSSTDSTSAPAKRAGRTSKRVAGTSRRVVGMFERPSAAMMVALQDFVFRHKIFVEAREFDDGRFFTRQRRWRSKKLGPRRHFEVFLRRDKRRVHVYSLTCVSVDHRRLHVSI